jgi:formylglycine-generating enzyme required for sulfatase activity
VPGGTFNRSNDATYPATVSGFRLDDYEVTVGRFRKFVAAYSQNMIAAGAGKNPNNAADPGWDTSWNASLPADATALTSTSYVKCAGGPPYVWTDSAGANENLPMGCIDWYEADAFCIWDGGRLPTESEWNYAAAGGSEQRLYPWGAAVPGANANLAVYGCYFNGTGTCTGITHIAPVGSVSAGNGKWGQSDLAGNVFEWVLDWYVSPYSQTSCTNCADLTAATGRTYRGGGSAYGASYLLTAYRGGSGGPTDRGGDQGVRCARGPGPACSPGAKQCSGTGVQVCDVNGQWGAAVACPAATPTCNKGACTGMSCTGLASTCGPAGNNSCCSSSLVPGGAFNRSNDATYPATVSDFRLDDYEVTVGRFRKFVGAYSQNMIAAGAGKNPNNASDPGWDTAWNASLPADATVLTTTSYLKCDATRATWTDAAGGNEDKPINCIDWYGAAAFCIWDGGRLVTEAEWNYAAAGGSEQRQYPWSNPPTSTTLDCTYANWGGDNPPTSACNPGPNNVGSESPKGDGKWGQSDLAGNVWEWHLDWYATPYSQVSCVNCANTSVSGSGARGYRGGSFDVGGPSSLLSSFRSSNGPLGRAFYVGARCARPAP